MRRIAMLGTGLAVALVCGALAAAAPAGADFSLTGSFGSFGSGAGQFDTPLGADVGEDGAVWVVDALNDRVQEWTAGGAFVRAFGSTGTGRGQFRLPEDVLQAGGFVYVSDCDNQRVQRFDRATLKPAGEFTGGAQRLVCPQGLAAGAAGDVWVADTFGDRLVDYDPATNTVLKVVGGKGNPLLLRPRGVARSPLTGDLYVTEGEPTTCANAHVRRLAADGMLLGSFGDAGPGALTCPLGVEVDPVGNVFAGDVAGRVSVYAPDGTFVRGLTPPGKFGFAYPIGLAGDATCGLDGELWCEGRTAAPAHDVGEMLAYASRGEILAPGDVISTGTMPGCCGLELERWIRPGQTVELEIDGIGTLANRIVPGAGPATAVPV